MPKTLPVGSIRSSVMFPFSRGIPPPAGVSRSLPRPAATAARDGEAGGEAAAARSAAPNGCPRPRSSGGSAGSRREPGLGSPARRAPKQRPPVVGAPAPSPWSWSSARDAARDAYLELPVLELGKLGVEAAERPRSSPAGVRADGVLREAARGRRRGARDRPRRDGARESILPPPQPFEPRVDGRQQHRGGRTVRPLRRPPRVSARAPSPFKLTAPSARRSHIWSCLPYSPSNILAQSTQPPTAAT